MDQQPPAPKGRGSHLNPPNRFGGLHYVPDWEQIEHDAEYLDDIRNTPTQYLPDQAKSIVTENNSPDVGFRYSVNPYRGCSHGCAYCYARPTHEYLGMSAGLDFETRILVKEDAPELLRRELMSPKWKPQTLALSGVTDPYQPIERRLQLSRRCLEVLCAFRNPVGIVTKSQLVARDADLLSELAKVDAAVVFVSLTTLDADLAGKLEPRAARPASAPWSAG